MERDRLDGLIESYMGYLNELTELNRDEVTEFVNCEYGFRISQWDVRCVENFEGLFKGKMFASNAQDGPLDIRLWDVRQGTNFAEMFQESTFNQDLCAWSDKTSCSSNTFNSCPEPESYLCENRNRCSMFLLSGCEFSTFLDPFGGVLTTQDVMCTRCREPRTPPATPVQPD